MNIDSVTIFSISALIPLVILLFGNNLLGRFRKNSKPILEIEMDGEKNKYGKLHFRNKEKNEHEETWTYKLKLKNNSSYSAYNVKLHTPDKLSCDKLSDITIQANEIVSLEATHVFKYKDGYNFTAKSPFPTSLQPLKIKLSYTDENKKKYTTIFSIENDKQTNKFNKD